MTLFRFPDIEEMSSSITPESNTRTFTSPFTKAIKTQGRTGERLRARLTFRNIKAPDRERLQALLIALNGHENRVLISDNSQTMRGSIAGVSELLDVLFNTTNWQTGNVNTGTLNSIDDGGIRSIISYVGSGYTIKVIGGADGIAGQAAGRIYAATMYVANRLTGAFTNNENKADLFIRETDLGNAIASSGPGTGDEKLKAAALCYDTSEFFIRPFGNSDSLNGPGNSEDLYDLSVARCLMIDDGVNSLLRSEEFDNASWTKNKATIDTNFTAAPDGLVTADILIEDGDPKGSSSFTW